jgi:aspartate 1-decarboxylase
VNYHGSVSIDSELMAAADIHEYEQVTVVNLSNGNRWETYAIAGLKGQFTLNGGGARLGELGDACVVLTYRQSEEFNGADVLFVDEKNLITETMRY